MDYARLISSLDWIKNGVRPRCPTVVCVQVISDVGPLQIWSFFINDNIVDTDMSVQKLASLINRLTVGRQNPRLEDL